MNYIIFTTDDCPYCDDTIDLLKKHKLNYRMVRFHHDQRYLLNDIKRSFDWPTVPIVIVRDKDKIDFIGGFDNLVERLEPNE